MNGKGQTMTAMGRVLLRIALLTLVLTGIGTAQAETWEEALAKMPLRGAVTELNKTNAVETLLAALQPNETVKGLVVMPGATDEYYFFHRGLAKITNAQPTLLDAVRALTSQTKIQVSFRPPLLLLRTEEDPAEPMIKALDSGMVAKLKSRPFVASFLYNDEDWNFVRAVLVKNISGKFLGFPDFLPPANTQESWHFFRHAVTGHGLTQWEALEALSLAGQTVVTVKRTKIIFEGDVRMVGKNARQRTEGK